MIYLACPYSHADRKVEAARAREVNRAAAALVAQGETVFSPISHSHEIVLSVNPPLSGSFNTWRELDTKILPVCDRLVVLMLDGWGESRGIRAEVALARELGIPIEVLEPGGEIRPCHVPLNLLAEDAAKAATPAGNLDDSTGGRFT